MQAEDFERHDHGTVRIHLCFSCAGIWFDHLASVQLAPAAVIELFKQVYAHRDDVRRPVAPHVICPRCDNELALNYDLSKSGRFSYFKCHRDDGRYTPFFQFLREKQFVRNLTPAELQQVRSQVRQITCSECGAPIELELANQCKYCHAPVSFLDPDAVEKAVRMWSSADHRRHLGPTPEALGGALLQAQLHNPRECRSGRVRLGDGVSIPGAETLAPDLVAWGIQLIGSLFD